mgnify:CR=1 FL=1
MTAALQAIGEQIRIQDNRATDAPIFIVQQRKRIYGIGEDYTDDYVWIDTQGDSHEADPEEAATLDAMYEEDFYHEGLKNWRRVGFIDIWEFVTACFTEKGCQDFIALNGHNLTDPRIYAAGSYRNIEYRTVRDYLKSL